MVGIHTRLGSPVVIPTLGPLGQRTDVRHPFDFSVVTTLPHRFINLADTVRYQAIQTGTVTPMMVLDRTDRLAIKFAPPPDTPAGLIFAREVAVGHALASGPSRLAHLPDFKGLIACTVAHAPETSHLITAWGYAMHAYLEEDGWLDVAQHLYGQDSIYHRLTVETLLAMQHHLREGLSALSGRGVKAGFHEMFVHTTTGDVVFYDLGHLFAIQLDAVFNGSALALTDVQQATVHAMEIEDDHFLAHLRDMAEAKRSDPVNFDAHATEQSDELELTARFHDTIADLRAADFVHIVSAPENDQLLQYRVPLLADEEVARFIAICACHYSGPDVFTELFARLQWDTPDVENLPSVGALMNTIATELATYRHFPSRERINTALRSPLHKASGALRAPLTHTFRYADGDINAQQWMQRMLASLLMVQLGRELQLRFLANTYGENGATNAELSNALWTVERIGQSLSAWENNTWNTLSRSQQQELAAQPGFPKLAAYFVEIMSRPIPFHPAS